jgi:hypothetical protein
MNHADDELDRLMARGGLGGAAREQILEAVLGKTAAREPRASRWRLWLGGLALAASAATAIALVVPAHRQGDEFRAKGGANVVPELGLDCQGGALTACPLGSTLIFRVSAVARAGYVQAYAEPRDGGERVWYFSAETQAPLVPARPGTQAVRQGVRLGPEHRPGVYRVHIAFSTTPLDRAALLAGSAPGLSGTAVRELNVVAP